MVPGLTGRPRVATPGYTAQVDAGHCDLPLPLSVHHPCDFRLAQDIPLLPIVPNTCKLACGHDETATSNICSATLAQHSAGAQLTPSTCDTPDSHTVNEGATCTMETRELTEHVDTLLAALGERLSTEARELSSKRLTTLGERLEDRLAEQARQLEALASGQERLLQLFSVTGMRAPSHARPSSWTIFERTSRFSMDHTRPTRRTRGCSVTSDDPVRFRTSFRLRLKDYMTQKSGTFHSSTWTKWMHFSCGSPAGEQERSWLVRQQIAAIINNDKVDFFMCLLILLNAIFLGVQADRVAKKPLEEESRGVRLVGSTFCWLFLGELLLRMVGFGWGFFVGSEWQWNLFDLAVVSCATTEEVITLLSLADIPSNMNILRIMRILKLARVIRIVRVFKFFRELRIMMLSMVASLRSLTWAVTLLLMVMFSFAVCLTTAVAEAVAGGLVSVEEVSEFGSMGATVLLLLQAITGGVDWSGITDVLAEISSLAAAVFVVYIVFVMFAVMNIMTGFFVENAMSSAEADLDRVINLQAEDRERTIKNLREVLQHAEHELKDTLSWHELEKHLREPKVQAYFKTLNLELMDLQSFFALVASDEEAHPTVKIDEFVRCCLRLKGPAKNADVVVLRHQLEKLTALVKQERQELQVSAMKLEGELKGL